MAEGITVRATGLNLDAWFLPARHWNHNSDVACIWASASIAAVSATDMATLFGKIPSQVG